MRASHVEFLVTNLERSRDFYVNVLGFVETSSDSDHVYLRGLEDRFHHCLVLTRSSVAAVGHMAYRVRRNEDLERLENLFSRRGLPVKRLKAGEVEEGQGPAIRAQDPLGFPVEFFKEMEEAEWMLRKFDQYRGGKLMRIDHFNVLVPDVPKASDWYTESLGFECSEYTETEGPEKSLWATWLRRKPTVHDIAIMRGVGPRLHHAGFVVGEKSDILNCADILASSGLVDAIERGPGRHGISNAFFLYIRDPDGHRVELYTGDYLTADPDWKPINWKLGDPQRQTFWGAPAPERWFNEASSVLSITDGSLVPTESPR